jgi:hypothetical protein
VNADVPLPFTRPVRVVAPVPPLPTAKVPATLTAPLVAVEGVKPVDPKLTDVTVAFFETSVWTLPKLSL